MSNFNTIRTYHHKETNSWTVSHNGVWLSGIYETEPTALLAVGQSDELLAQLLPICNFHGQNRPITKRDIEDVLA